MTVRKPVTMLLILFVGGIALLNMPAIGEVRNTIVVPNVDTSPVSVAIEIYGNLGKKQRFLSVGTDSQDALRSMDARYDVDAMMVARIPVAYGDDGARVGWKGPLLIRMATTTMLPAGEHRLLMRAPYLARVWIDGKVVAKSDHKASSTSAHHPVAPLSDPPMPNGRRAKLGTCDTMVQVTREQAGSAQVIFELVLGSEQSNINPLESLVAIQLLSKGSFTVLRPLNQADDPIELTDADVQAYLDVAERELQKHDDTTRSSKRQTLSNQWSHRHERAVNWITGRTVERNQLSLDPNLHPVDGYLKAQRENADRATPGAKSWSTKESSALASRAISILRERCFRCHDETAEGGIQLNRSVELWGAGDSGIPVVVPNETDASGLIQRITSNDDAEQMPPSGKLVDEEIQVLSDWIREGATQTRLTVVPEPRPRTDPASLLRRVYLDIVGVPPTASEVERFLDDDAPFEDRYIQVVDRLLDDPRYVDHQMGYWLDLTAENASVLKPTLNNTGAFRFYLQDALRDNLPLDRLVSGLIEQHGHARLGGAAGFGLSTENDVPAAARATVVTGAFWGLNTQCARCHDAPYHKTKQRELFSLSAMFANAAIKVPSSSSVPPEFFVGRDVEASDVEVTLLPGSTVEPNWPFLNIVPREQLDLWAIEPLSHRSRLAAAITSPISGRFEQTIANGIWARLIGTGIIDTPTDWEASRPSHPQLLRHLGDVLIKSHYDLKQLIRHIVTSDVYQAVAAGDSSRQLPEERFFAGPDRRRLTAEQIVDSLVSVTGSQIKTESLTFDPQGINNPSTMIDLGFPKRAWQFVPMSNERDRPSLSLPIAGEYLNLLTAFDWDGARNQAFHQRQRSQTLTQPGSLLNSVLVDHLIAASEHSQLANWASEGETAEQLADFIHLQFLGRPAEEITRGEMVDMIQDGFESRLVPPKQQLRIDPLPELETVSWTNHLHPRANEIRVEQMRRLEWGPNGDPGLDANWRARFEDMCWALINTPEFVWMP